MANNRWLAERRRCTRTRPLTPLDACVFLLLESEARAGPGCQLAVETMARRLGVSGRTVRRSLVRLQATNLLLVVYRPGLLPRLRLPFHPFDREAVSLARRAIDFHGRRGLGEDWRRRARAFLRNRTRRIERARLSVRRASANGRKHHPTSPPPEMKARSVRSIATTSKRKPGEPERAQLGIEVACSPESATRRPGSPPKQRGSECRT